MKKILSIILTLTLSATVFAQPLPKKLEHNEKMAWWRNAKFGMFVHWGPYCLYGGVYNGFNQRRGGAEWIMNRCKIPVREYRAKACTFNPVHARRGYGAHGRLPDHGRQRQRGVLGRRIVQHREPSQEGPHHDAHRVSDQIVPP